MKRQALFELIGVLIVLALISSACAPPAPESDPAPQPERPTAVEQKVAEPPCPKWILGLLWPWANPYENVFPSGLIRGAEQAAAERCAEVRLVAPAEDGAAWTAEEQVQRARQLSQETDFWLIYPVDPESDEWDDLSSGKVVITFIHRIKSPDLLVTIAFGYGPLLDVGYKMGAAAVTTAVDYLADGIKPPEMIVGIPDTILPDPMAGATIFSPPYGNARELAQKNLEDAIRLKNGGLLEKYDVGQVVVFPEPYPDRWEYEVYAAPVRWQFSEFPVGTPVGVYWDAHNRCGHGSDVVYEVSFASETDQPTTIHTAVLEGKNANGGTVFCNQKAYYAPQPEFLPGTTVFFGQVNPCIVCWRCDSGNACLFCW